MKKRTVADYTWTGWLEIEPEDDDVEAYSVDVTVELSHWVPYRRATHLQPEEGGYYEEATVTVHHPEPLGDVELLSGADYEMFCDAAAEEARTNDDADLGDFLYDQMREEGF